MLTLEFVRVIFVEEWLGNPPLSRKKLFKNKAKELEARGVVKVFKGKHTTKEIKVPPVDKMIKNSKTKKRGRPKSKKK